MTYDQLKQEHPVLAEYDKLSKERVRVTGYRAEKLDKVLLVKAQEVMNNTGLYNQLSANNPNSLWLWQHV